MAIDPTYGMYQVCADVNDVEYRKVLLNTDYSLDSDTLLKAVDERTKVIFLCSPNNPTGNLLNRTEMLKVIHNFHGVVVIDEAYIDFSSEKSWLAELDSYPNVIVFQTFSKAWGLASLRCGMAFASEEIISYFNKVKYPYNVNILTQNFVKEQLEEEARKNDWAKMILEQRIYLVEALKRLPLVEKVYPTDANFLLVNMILLITNAKELKSKQQLEKFLRPKSSKLTLAQSFLFPQKKFFVSELLAMVF